MSNPEYENKVNPTELYNDDILAQFEAIRNVIHKEILPSTYNELIVTSNQAGTLTNYMAFNSYPQSEIIFPLSPQSGNINWLEKNFLRFRFRISDSNDGSTTANFAAAYFPTSYFAGSSYTTIASNSVYINYGVIDGASIFKSVELNYAGTAIWTSAYQQVESFFTFCSLPAQVVVDSNQYWTSKNDASACTGTNSQKGTSLGSISPSLVIDVDISRLSPILSWLSIIPGFINKLTLRVIIDAPHNWMSRRIILYSTIDSQVSHALYNNVIYPRSMILPLSKPGYSTALSSSVSNWNESLTTWCCDICEIHQCNATMTEDTRIRLIALIQQLGGKWIYPCRYWNTAIAPIQTISAGTSTNVNFQYVLTGCYFRCLAFTIQSVPPNPGFIIAPGNFCYTFPSGLTNVEIYCDSELLVQYPGSLYSVSDTSSALMDSDKYSINPEVASSMYDNGPDGANRTYYKDVIMKATGPPNGMYSGKYTSEKMGTHNILLKITYTDTTQYTFYSWCSALQDGVIVFDNFNGSYFSTARKMQQVYEALT